MNQTLSKWAPMPLRLILGVGFLYHGAPKLFSAPDHQMFLGMLQGMVVPAAGLMAWVVGIVEVLGGLALIVGDVCFGRVGIAYCEHAGRAKSRCICRTGSIL